MVNNSTLIGNSTSFYPDVNGESTQFSIDKAIWCRFIESQYIFAIHKMDSL